MIFQQADANNDHKISRAEFIKHMNRTKCITDDVTPTIETTNMEDGERVLAQLTPHVLKKTGNQGKKGIL